MLDPGSFVGFTGTSTFIRKQFKMPIVQYSVQRNNRPFTSFLFTRFLLLLIVNIVIIKTQRDEISQI